MVQQLVWVRHRPGWYDNWGSLVCPWVTWPYIPGNAIPLAADPSLAGADNPVADTAAAVDTGAEHTAVDHTEAAVGHMQVAHTEAAVGTVVARTEVVVDRMQVAHTVAAVAANNPVDHTVSDTAAAVVGIAQTASGLTVSPGLLCWRRLQEGCRNLNRSVHLEHPVARSWYRS